jgi:hypothetical protein
MSNVEHSSSLRAEGRVRIYRVPDWLLAQTFVSDAMLARHGEVMSDTKNLIVTSGLQWMSRKLGHILGTPPIQVGGQTVTTLAELQVSKIKLGNAGAPAAPAAGDTALADLTPLATYTTLTVSYPANGTVRHAATIAPNTLNGQAVTEVGLFCTINSTDILIGRALPSPVTVIAPATGYTVTYDIILTAV